MGGSYYPIPCLILSIGKDRKTSQQYPDVQTTPWRISIQSMESILGILHESWNDLRDLSKPVKAIALPQDVLSTSDRRLVGTRNQVQRLMEAHLAHKPSVQVNKIASSCEICSVPHDTQYCMENPKQSFVNYASLRIDEAG
ncbi:hypothetical protein Tco_0197805, partial [Tanacetum coccineum]